MTEYVYITIYCHHGFPKVGKIYISIVRPSIHLSVSQSQRQNQTSEVSNLMKGIHLWYHIWQIFIGNVSNSYGFQN